MQITVFKINGDTPKIGTQLSLTITTLLTSELSSLDIGIIWMAQMSKIKQHQYLFTFVGNIHVCLQMQEEGHSLEC